MIRKKDVDNVALQQKFQAKRNDPFGIHIRVGEVPAAILQLSEIKSLSIDFIDKIVIPERLGQIKIERLILNGEISKTEIQRLANMFPNTHLRINGQTGF